MMAGVAFIFWSALGLAFARSTEALSRRAKRWALESILSQDIAFFDRKDRSTGALLEVVTGSTEQLSSLSGPVIGSVLTFLSTILAGIVISLVIGWKLALVCTATIPIVVACGWIRLRMLAVFDGQVKETGKEAASYASETVRLVRTVASLGIEEFALDRYDEILSQRAATSLRSMLSASALYAASQSVVFLCAALAFWYGGQLVSTGEYSVFQFYICFVALISGAQTAGSIFSYAPDASKAMHASYELKSLLASKSKMIGTPPGDGRPNEKKHSTDGIQLELSDVDFRYPSRPDHQVLQNFNLTISAGQYIALVGPSGCGKSTILALLERFYDPDKGVVRVDGVALPALNVQQHRQNVSLVSQGAALYSGTIRENIALGRQSSDGNPKKTTDQNIMDVCKQANIHDFITSLP
jgi:ATP-binding cassette subfamily B (MDR/TAP) protein 1